MKGFQFSLKWRIAAGYALLLIATLIATSSIIAWRFQSILYDESRSRVDSVMNEIAQAAMPQPNPYAPLDLASESITQLFNSNNLAVWESPTSFIQVDSPSGYPLAKTTNLGAARIPPNTDLDLQNAAFRTVFLDGRPFLVEDRILRSGAFAAIVHVAEPLDALYRTFEQTRRVMFFVVVAATAAVVVLSIVVASQAIDPITKLSQAMREIRSDRLHLRLNWRVRHDEIGDLTSSFDDLLARLDEAFARERQFISDASHELKTPLTSINANAQLLLRWGDRDETIRRESLETIAAESSALAGMVNGMLTLAKADRGDTIPKEPMSLSYIAQDAVKSAMQRATEKGLDLEADIVDRNALIVGDESLMRQLAGNLIDNAIKFTERGRIDVRVGADAARAWIEVDDSGPGIPEAEWAHVFDRFYRTDKARSREIQGTGLGLAIVRSIARVHNGTVQIKRGRNGGACFRASFPRLPDGFTAIS